MRIKNMWEELREGIISCIENENSLEKIKKLIIDVLEKIQYSAMSEEKNTKLRQEIGILFSSVKNNINILDIVGEVSIWSSNKNTDLKNNKKEKLIMIILHVLMINILILIFQRYFVERNYLGILGGIFVIIVEIGIIIFGLKIYKEKVDGIKTTQKGEIEINKEKAIKYMDNLFESLDRYVYELELLTKEEIIEDDTINREMLLLFQSFDEGIKTKNEIIISKINESISNILLENNIKKIDYKQGDEKYFDFLPSKTMEITIKPAFIKKDTKKVLLRGVATKKIDI